MSATEIEYALAVAAESGTAVTVKRADGREFSGVPVHTDVRLAYSIRTGRRGRPPVVHVDDVADVQEVAAA